METSTNASRFTNEKESLKKHKQKNVLDKNHNENRHQEITFKYDFKKSKCVPLNIVKNYPSSSSITKQALPAMIRVESAFCNNEKSEKLKQRKYSYSTLYNYLIPK